MVFVRNSGGFPGATAGVDVDSFDLRLHFLDADPIPLTTDADSDYDDPYADMPDLVALDDDGRLDMHNPDGSSRRCFVPPTPLNE